MPYFRQASIMVAVPMIGLYELSILLSRLVGKLRKQAVPAEDAPNDPKQEA